MIKIFSTQQGLNLRNALFKNEVRFVSRQEVCGRLTASFSLYLTPIPTETPHRPKIWGDQ